jgi:hypothetical protein
VRKNESRRNERERLRESENKEKRE